MGYTGDGISMAEPLGDRSDRREARRLVDNLAPGKWCATCGEERCDHTAEQRSGKARNKDPWAFHNWRKRG